MQPFDATLRASLLTATVALCGGLGACSDAALTGGSSKKKSSPTSPDVQVEESSGDGPTNQKEPPNTPEKDPTKTESPVDPTLARCLEDWTDHPFSDAELAAPTFAALDQSNANNGVIYRDDSTTQTPKLVIVVITSKNVNTSRVQLLNPQAWYCVDIRSKAANNFKIEATCDAKIATLEHSEHVANGFAVERSGCP